MSGKYSDGTDVLTPGEKFVAVAFGILMGFFLVTCCFFGAKYLVNHVDFGEYYLFPKEMRDVQLQWQRSTSSDYSLPSSLDRPSLDLFPSHVQP